MQTVLSIDATREPALAVVANVDGANINVVETRELSLVQKLENGSTSAEGGQALDANASPEPPPETKEGPISPAAFFSTPFTNTVIIVPPHDYLSFNLALPFSDAKQLGKLVEPELQDLVPFDTNDLILNYAPTGGKIDGNFDIHVSSAPKSLIKGALDGCRQYGLDPISVSTPASVLEALAVINPTLIASTAVCIYCRGDFCSIEFRIEGTPRSEKIINRRHLPKPVQGGAYPYGAASAQMDPLLRQIKVAVTSAERQFNTPFDQIYLVGDELDRTEIAALLRRSVVVLRLSDMIGSSPEGGELAVLGAVFAEDSRTSKLLTNFRVGEFAFRPPLKELLLAFKAVGPLFGLCLLLLVVMLGSSYASKQFAISRIRKAVTDQIKVAAPDVPLTPGSEVESLQNEANKIDDQLKDLGSPQSYSPLEAFAQATEAFPNIRDVSIDKVRIRNNKVRLEGCAPDYGAIEQIENALKKQHVFANVKRQDPPGCAPGGQASKGFAFEIWLRE